MKQLTVQQGRPKHKTKYAVIFTSLAECVFISYAIATIKFN